MSLIPSVRLEDGMNKNVVYTGQTDLKHDSLSFLHITLIIKLQSYFALDSYLVF